MSSTDDDNGDVAMEEAHAEASADQQEHKKQPDEEEPEWSNLCFRPPSQSTTATATDVNNALHDLARNHFASLPRGKNSRISVALSELVSSLESVLGGPPPPPPSSSDSGGDSGGGEGEGEGGEASNSSKKGGGAVAPRTRSLHILSGAIEGCGCTTSSSSSSSLDTGTGGNGDEGGGGDANEAGLNYAVITQVGRFLLHHCRPFAQDYTTIDADSEENDEDDIGESVRDAACNALRALVSCPIVAGENGKKEGDDIGKAILEQSIQLRLDLATRAVEARCLSDDMTDYEHQYDGGATSATATAANGGSVAALGGLATLPRARRSLCFDILEGAVDGVDVDCNGGAAAADINEISSASTLRKNVILFVTFVSTCLHGETDPRCLLQMLGLLHRCQVVLLPLFASSSESEKAQNDSSGDGDNNGMEVDATDGGSSPKDDEAAAAAAAAADEYQFPTVSMFDSVAPYYPIKFTPPPNDPHGITREGLRGALMAILCTLEPTTMGKDAETMTTLAARLFLERLVPPKLHDPYGEEDDYDDGVESTVDKIEALNDLKELLLPNTTTTLTATLHPLNTVDSSLIKELSSALIKVHSDSVVDMSAASDSKERDSLKMLLDECRSLSSGLASTLEDLDTTNSPSASSLWSSFVLDTVRELSSVLTTAPQGMKGRSSTAYLASLAVCGGVRTLRACLDGCLPPLLGVLRDHGGDEEKAAAAALATGTLFSSSEKSLSQASRGGVVSHPHPLQQYASDSIRVLCGLQKEGGQGIKVAAVTGLGAALLAIPSFILAEDEVGMIQQELVVLSTQISLNGAKGEANDSDLSYACSRVVGSALGRALGSQTEQDIIEDHAACVLDDNDGTIAAIVEKIFPAVIESAASASSSGGGKGKRYDYIALANACEVGGKNASRFIVSEIVSSILRKLNAKEPPEGADAKQDYGKHRAIAPATALSYVIRKGGDNSAMVYHELSPPNNTPSDVIEALCAYKGKDGNTSRREVGMSKLMLPNEIEQEVKDATDAVHLAYKILPHIIPAYQGAVPVPAAEVERIIDSVSKVLPPLSQRDNVRLSVLFPLLAAILGNSHTRNAGDVMNASLLERLEVMTSSVADYALCSDWDPRARSASSSCLFLILMHYQQDKAKCIGPAILKDCILPSASSASEQYHQSEGEEGKELSLESLKSCLDLFAVVGSAAACRGGVSSPTADAVTRFLVDLACKGEANAPFTERTITLHGSSPGSADYTLPLMAMAASSFGLMLSVQNGGAFWRQRMVHIALPSILALNKSAEAGPLSAVSGPPMGALVVACHIVCCTPLVVVGEQRSQELINMIARGYVEFANALTSDKSSSSHFVGWNDLMSGLLASLLKLICVSPDSMVPYLAGLIPNFLVVCNASSQEEDIPCQLLALQCLVAATHLSSAKRICKAHKLTVTSGVGALTDHPSSIIRQAAVHTMNVWCILE